MMNVLIEIKGKQIYEDGHDDSTVFTTSGVLNRDGDVILLSYNEGADIGAENVETLFKLKNEQIITISRKGAMNSELVIEKGRRHSCFYGTPYGDFTVGIYGEELKVTCSENIIIIDLTYTIDVNSGLISKNIMKIKIKEIDNVGNCN